MKVKEDSGNLRKVEESQPCRRRSPAKNTNQTSLLRRTGSPARWRAAPLGVGGRVDAVAWCVCIYIYIYIGL